MVLSWQNIKSWEQSTNNIKIQPFEINFQKHLWIWNLLSSLIHDLVKVPIAGRKGKNPNIMINEDTVLENLNTFLVFQNKSLLVTCLIFSAPTDLIIKGAVPLLL